VGHQAAAGRPAAAAPGRARGTELRLVYEDEQARRTERSVRPVAIVYYVAVNVLAAWRELRRDFRHFRLDRIQACAAIGERFARQGEKLRASWRLLHRIP